jgi:hypothetical protein
MVDQPPAQPAGGASHCPWCSAELPSDAVERCPSCDATLHGETEAALPGVTAIDADAIVRNARMPTSPRRSRLLSWLGGEDATPDEAPAPPGSLAPPPPAVRREILRLELQADIANLQAEADSIVAEAEVEAREEGGEASAPNAAEVAPTEDGSTNGAAAAGATTATATDDEPQVTEPSRPTHDGTSASA